MEDGILVFKKPKDIAKKLKTYSHQEFNKNNFTNIKNIEKKIIEKSDIFGRNYKYEKIEIDEKFPKYIRENKEKFKEWIL